MDSKSTAGEDRHSGKQPRDGALFRALSRAPQGIGTMREAAPRASFSRKEKEKYRVWPKAAGLEDKNLRPFSAL